MATTSCVLLLLIAVLASVAHSQATGTVLYHSHLGTAVFTNAAMSSQTALGTDATATFSTWLNKPIEAFAVMGTAPNASTIWHHYLDKSTEAYMVDMARHATLPAVGVVDTIVTEVSSISASMSTFVVISGFASTVRGESKAIWRKVYSSSFIDCIDGTADMVSFSDDGSTVAVYLFVYNKAAKAFITEFMVLDGQSGDLVYSKAPAKANAPGQEAYTSISANGDVIVFCNGNYVYFYNRAGVAIAEPLVRQYAGFATLDPLGVYLAYGVLEVTVAAWNGTAFATEYTIPDNSTYDAEDVSISYTYGAVAALKESVADWSDRDGLLAAVRALGGPVAFLGISWADADNGAKSDAVSVVSLTTGDLMFTWYSPTNVQTQTVAAVQLTGNYMAVCTWGDDHATAATILLFDSLSSAAAEPVFKFHTPGSMFAIDLSIVSQDQTGDVVLVAAAGKAVPASEMGNGGDAYLISVAIPSTA